MQDISSLFKSAEETVQPETSKFTGRIPGWLEGSFFQIGPGKLDLTPTCSLNDWLDGYGIISKLTFSPSQGSVTLSKKFVETDALRLAEETGAPQFTEFATIASPYEKDKGLFSKMITSISSMMKEDLSDNCSASMTQIGGHLVASAPTSFFQEINPTTLQTGRKFEGKKYFGQNGLGVHPIMDQEGNLWNMGFSVLPTFKYNIIKIPKAKLTSEDLPKILERAKTVSSISSRWTGAFAFNHSFGMSKSFIIFVEQPYVIKISRVLSSKLKGSPVKEWLEWRPEDKNRFYIVNKATGRVINGEIMSQESFFFLHFVNCFEDKDHLIMDIATCPNPSSTEATTLSKLRKNELNNNIQISRIQRFVIPLNDYGGVFCNTPINLSTHGGPNPLLNFSGVPENTNLIRGDFKGSFEFGSASAFRKGSTLVLIPDDITPQGVDRMSINKEVQGKKYQFLYGSGSFLSGLGEADEKQCPFAHAVCKIHVDSKKIERWGLSITEFPGEPLFVPEEVSGEKKGEDDGVIICAVETTPTLENGVPKDNFIVVLDAKSFKEIARASFKTRFNGALHGIFLKSVQT